MRRPSSAPAGIPAPLDVRGGNASSATAGNVTVKVGAVIRALTRDGDLAAVQLDELPDERQPQPSPPSGRLADEFAWRNRSNTCGRNSGEMPFPVSATIRRTLSPSSLDAHVDGAAGGRELDGVRQQVPDDLLHAIRIAVDEPGVAPSSFRIVMFLACAAGVTTSIAASVAATRSTGSISSRSLPLMMRAMSSMSSISRTCADGVALDDLERARRASPGRRSRAEQDARPAEHRVERRADLVRQRRQELVLHARALPRPAARACSAAAIWRRSSRFAVTRSLTSSTTVIVPTTASPSIERRDARALRHLARRRRLRGSAAGSGGSGATAR